MMMMMMMMMMTMVKMTMMAISITTMGNMSMAEGRWAKLNEILVEIIDDHCLVQVKSTPPTAAAAAAAAALPFTRELTPFAVRSSLHHRP